MTRDTSSCCDAINKGAIAENEAKPEKTVATGRKMELLLPSQETLHTSDGKKIYETIPEICVNCLS